MKKGFEAYLEERSVTDYDFGCVLENMTLQAIGDEYDVSKQAIGKTLRLAMDKLYYGLQSASPEMSPGEIFYILSQVIKTQNPRDIFMSLGFKTRKAIQDDAREKGIGV